MSTGQPPICQYQSFQVRSNDGATKPLDGNSSLPASGDGHQEPVGQGEDEEEGRLEEEEERLEEEARLLDDHVHDTVGVVVLDQVHYTWGSHRLYCF